MGVPQFDIFLCDDAERIRNTFHDQTIAEQQIKLLSDADQDMVLKNRFISAKLLWQPRAYNPALAKWLHRIDVPTGIIWGDNDQLFPLPYATAFQNLIPGAGLTVIEDCGHIPNIEKPDEFVTAVTDFIEVYVGRYHWPTFNAADSAISIGIVMMALDALWLHRREATSPVDS